jgi:thiamine-phosphate pyrophosphorylase
MRAILRHLPPDSGVLVLAGNESAGFRRLASERKLTVVQEGTRRAARVHDIKELRRALLQRIPLILLSPIHPTATHPDWHPIPIMRAAALARLGGRRLVALGGMDARKFKRVERFGFQGWAGISAFRT